MRASPQLCVELRPSRLAGAAILLGAAVVAALVISLPLGSWATSLTMLSIGVVASRGLRQCAGRGVPARIKVGLDRRLAVTDRDGRVREGSILDDSYVGERLTTIVWRADGARWYEPAHAILLTVDSLGADDFRRLRVILRYGQPGTDRLASSRDAG